MKIQANRIQVGYDTAGPADGPPVLLSHSLGSSRVMWDPTMPAFGPRLHVVRYDTRGHGESDAPEGPYTLDLLGDDAVALMDALGLDRVHWVGLSMGGMIGQNLALRYPERLASLTLCDTAAVVPPEARPMWDERIDLVRSRGMEGLVEATMERWFTEPYLARRPAAVEPIRAQFRATPPAGFIGCCHAIKALDQLDGLAAVRVPTLIIVGADDPSTPVAASEAIRERIPSSELVVLPSAAHLANVEQPERFNAALGEFLAEHALPERSG